jgi:hypothetical protein
MEVNQQKRAAGLKDKMPDIQKTLDTVRFLKTRKVRDWPVLLAVQMLTVHAQPDSDPIEATFELNDTLYAKAHIPPTNEVYLWLGVCQTKSLSLKLSADLELGKCDALVSCRRGRRAIGL